MRLGFCVLASFLAACSDPASPPKTPPPTQAYYQDYVVSERPPGFKLENQIEPSRADPKRFYWRATYDREGRIVTLETFAHPMCLQSQLNLTYAGKATGKEQAPAKRQRHPASDCKLARPL
jgi:hypothetical protein